ncbi:MAG: hypothetical protein E7525_06595 [Ruminococcaceae bacterium]|nr:hypothetical protein [Oscillospiraceae bacterium]
MKTTRRLLSYLLAVCLILSSVPMALIGVSAVTAETDEISAVAEGNVAKVGNTEYATINEAIVAWTNGTTLTLLSDVTLSDVIKLSSTEYHILDLGTYTLTAASKKDAIQIVNNGRSSAGYALDIKADATNPGGITATGKAVVRTAGKSGVKDRPIIRFYNGVFNASYIVYHSGSNGTNCPQFQFYGGVFNGTIFTNRTLNQFYGGTFNGSLMMSVDSSAYTLVAGGTFKSLSNLYMSALNSGKFTIGSAKGVYDKEIYVDDNGYYVVAAVEPAEGYEASVAKNPGSNDYLAYSKVETEGVLNYTDATLALKNNKTATVTVYSDKIDLAGVDFTGTIVVPEGNELIIVNAPEGLKVEGDAKLVNYVAKVGEQSYETLAEAIAAASSGDTVILIANVDENVTINNNITIDGAGKVYTGQMILKANTTIRNVNFDGKGYDGYAVETRGATYVTIEDCTAKNYGYGFLQLVSGTACTTVKNVAVTDVNYGVKINYSSKVVLDNVDITAAVAGVLNSNYGEKTITVKNSKINIFGTWTRNNTTKTNIVFEGDNTVDEFIIDENIDNFKLVAGATLAAPAGLTITVDRANFDVLYEDGVYQTFDYIEYIKAELLAGRDVVLQKDIVVDGSYIDSIPAKTNGNGTYFNPGIFNVVGDSDVTFDLNGHTITYNGHAIAEYTATYNKNNYYNAATGKYEIQSCTVAHGLFMANDGGKLTIVGDGNVTVHGLASGVYPCSPDSVITVEGGNWYNDGCATCGGTNIFLYASHGGELYINGGTFEQTLDANGDSYLIVEHGGNSANSVIDYSKTKVVISGGSFVGMNPENAVFIDQGNGQAFGKTNVVDDDYVADDLGNGIWGIADAVAKIEGAKGYETLDAAFAAAKSGDKVVLLENVDAGATVVMIPAGVTFDLNGYYLTASNFLSFGDVIDTAEEVGGLVISNDTTISFTILQKSNTFMSIYDTAAGCYRFFEYQVVTKGVRLRNNGLIVDDQVAFGYAVEFTNMAAYKIIVESENTGLAFTAKVTVNNGNKTNVVVLEFTDELVKTFADKYIKAVESNSTSRPGLVVKINGLSKIDTDVNITCVATATSVATHVTDSSESSVYNSAVTDN